MLLLMVQICGLPDRSLANAIWDPSGDQVGSPSYPPELVRRLGPPVARANRNESSGDSTPSLSSRRAERRGILPGRVRSPWAQQAMFSAGRRRILVVLAGDLHRFRSPDEPLVPRRSYS